MNSSKEKVKTELLPKDSVLELITKKLDNSPSFLTIPHMTLSAKRFRSYRILTIDVAAKFCFRTEQWQNKSLVSSVRLPETLEVPNTVLVDNSLCIPMVH
jgi:hypothetical protein